MLMTQGINYIRSCFPNPCPLERKLILICHIYSPSCKSKLHIISYDLIKPINNYVNKMLKRGSINPLHVSPYYSLSLLSNCVNKYTVEINRLFANRNLANRNRKFLQQNGFLDRSISSHREHCNE